LGSFLARQEPRHGQPSVIADVGKKYVTLMSTTDLAKDFVRIASTAGLSKDVIDLLEKKLSLLAEENLFFKESLSKAIAENEVLKLKVIDLENQLEDSCLQENRLNKECEEILFLFFETDQHMSADQIAKHFNLHPSVAKAHFDTLRNRGFIFAQGRIVIGHGPHPPAKHQITVEGRAYSMQHRTK
jgi:regulator of replication initiation timing